MRPHLNSLFRGNSRLLHFRDLNLQILTFAVLAFSVSWLGAQEEIPFLEWSHPRGEQEIHYISIFDMLGREALQIEVNKNTSSTTINLNELSSGLYVVSLSDNRQNSKLILKQ